MKYILTTTITPLDKETIRYVQSTPDTDGNDCVYTNNIEKACLVDEATKDKYFDIMKRAGAIADAYECNELTPESVGLISALSKLRCWDNGNIDDDRFIVVSPNGDYVSINKAPFNPKDFALYGNNFEYSPEIHVDSNTHDRTSKHGTLIPFYSLPDECKKLVVRDISLELFSNPELESKTAGTERSAFFKEAFTQATTRKPYDVPENLKQISIRICNAHNIKGICDPMYIANVVALELGMGDGNSNFKGYARTIDEIEDFDAKVQRLSQRLCHSYSATIKDTPEGIANIIKETLNEFTAKNAAQSNEKTSPTLNQALTTAIEHYGRRWKKDIAVAWETGNYKGLHPQAAAELQKARNTLGPQWLAKVKDPRGMKR